MIINLTVVAGFTFDGPHQCVRINLIPVNIVFVGDVVAFFFYYWVVFRMVNLMVFDVGMFMPMVFDVGMFMPMVIDVRMFFFFRFTWIVIIG